MRRRRRKEVGKFLLVIHANKPVKVHEIRHQIIDIDTRCSIVAHFGCYAAVYQPKQLGNGRSVLLHYGLSDVSQSPIPKILGSRPSTYNDRCSAHHFFAIFSSASSSNCCSYDFLRIGVCSGHRLRGLQHHDVFDKREPIVLYLSQ